MKYYIFLHILVVFVLTITVFLALQTYNPRTIENFLDFTFKPAYKSSIVAKAGIEPCTVLDNNSITSQLFLGTLRLRKEKPASKSTTECYYFTDKDPAKTILKGDIPGRSLPPVADPLSAYPCDKDANPILRDVSFINAAREVSTPDATLREGITYNRCVLDIDPTKATPQALSQFWAPLEPSPQSLPCAAQLTALGNEASLYRTRINQVSNEITELNRNLTQLRSSSNDFRRTNQLNRKTPSEIATAATACESLTPGLRNDLATAESNYTNTLAAITREKESTYALIDSLRANTADLQKDIDAIASQQQPVSSKVAYYATVNEQLNSQFSDLSRRNDGCSQKLMQQSQLLSANRAQNADLLSQRDRLLQNRANADQALQALKSINAQLTAEQATTRARADKAKSDADACNRQLQITTTDATYWTEEFAKIKAALEACQRQLSYYNSQNDVLEMRIKQFESVNPNLQKDQYELQVKLRQAALDNAQLQTAVNSKNAELANAACQRAGELNLMASQIQAYLIQYNKVRDRVFLLPSCDDVVKNCGCPFPKPATTKPT